MDVNDEKPLTDEEARAYLARLTQLSCSDCGYPNLTWNFCPNCGAKFSYGPPGYREALSALCKRFAADQDEAAFTAGLLAIKREFEPPEIKRLRAEVARLSGETFPNLGRN